MIISRIRAGLGNQMFQYACGRALALRNNDKLKLDISDYTLGKEKKRSYLLGNFNIVENIATDREIQRLKYPFGALIGRILDKARFMAGITNLSFMPRVFTKKGDVYLDGYWQSERYFIDFAEKIRNDFTLKNPLSKATTQMLEKIQKDECPISVNIRRGDNAHEAPSMKTFGCPGIEYYTAALDTLIDGLKRRRSFTGDARLYIFSDEIEWAKQNLRTDFPVVFVSGKDIDTCEEIMLMSSCKHNIISNSTFGWWGAWLNQNEDRIIIAPKIWVLVRPQNYKDIIPGSWIRV